MKTFRKVMAILSALAVMSLSATAFAEVSGSFDGDVVTADLTNLNAAGGNRIVANVDATKAIVGQEMTFVVFNNDVTGTDIANGNITADDILYIDQKTLANTTEGKKFTGAINLSRVNGYESGDTLVDGDYPVRVGYYYDDPSEGRTFGIAAATIHVSSTAPETSVTLIWGDIDGDGSVQTFDANEILYATINAPNTVTVTDTKGDDVATLAVGSTLLGKLIWGDIDGDGSVQTFDANEILYATINAPNTVTVTDASGNDVDTIAVGSNLTFTYSE